MVLYALFYLLPLPIFPLRRYAKRWSFERLFASMHNFHRLVVRHEYHAEHFLGFVHLACIIILLRRGF
jgi:transposase